MSFNTIRDEIFALNGSVREPALNSDFALFEAKFEVEIPFDAKAAFGIMNGADYPTNPEKAWMRFWPIDEWRPAVDLFPEGAATKPCSELSFVVADYAIECVYYVLDLEAASPSNGQVFALGATHTSQVARSFADFVQMVCDNSQELHSYS
ncbi:hypothetical protein [Polaromonas sp.]|uniref:hypothetical protein n=1 Tax=Polaromonas sp. TaxID=1869339 RepID=UPI0032668BCB